MSYSWASSPILRRLRELSLSIHAVRLTNKTISNHYINIQIHIPQTPTASFNRRSVELTHIRGNVVSCPETRPATVPRRGGCYLYTETRRARAPHTPPASNPSVFAEELSQPLAATASNWVILLYQRFDAYLYMMMHNLACMDFCSFLTLKYLW